MSKQLRYVIRVRQHGEPWRQLWAGEGEQVAVDAAKALARETRIIVRTICIPVHPYIRVTQGKRVVFEVTPLSREKVA